MKFEKINLFAMTAAAVGIIAVTLFSVVAMASGADDGHVDKKPQAMTSAVGSQSGGQMMNSGEHLGRLMMPKMDPVRGMKVFVDKGCVTCHAINGVGGEDAPAMDAHEMDKMMNPFDFAAKMWNHAPSMIAAQESELGEQVMLTGQELADIIAFVHHDETQHAFSKESLSGKAREMMKMHDDGGHGDEAGADNHD
jgi:cytochrome c